MNDIYLDWGGDLALSDSGDLAVVSGTSLINQRVCRRLLTNSGDYLWNRTYGGGLSMFIGTPLRPYNLKAVISSQLSLEAALPATPPPQVAIQLANSANGVVVATVTYADPATNQTIQIDIPSSRIL